MTTTKKPRKTATNKAKTSATRSKTGSAKVKQTSPGKKQIPEFRIREKAHEIYMQRLQQGRAGSHESDWLEAEQELQKT